MHSAGLRVVRDLQMLGANGFYGWGGRHGGMCLWVKKNRIKAVVKWLPHKDSNLNKQIQNLRCYHYTMRQ